MNDLRNNGFWIGVDISKATFDATLAPSGTPPRDWAALPSKQFNQTTAGVNAFVAWVAAQASPERCEGVCAESTGIYSEDFARALAKRGGLPAVSIVNPARPLGFIKSMGLREKTDRSDAAALALYGWVHCPRPKALLEGSRRRLRDCQRLREDYVEDLCRERNRYGQAKDAFVKRQLTSTINHLKGKIDAVTKQMEACVKEDEAFARDAKLLRTVPGIGPLTTLLLLAEIGDLREWTRRELVGYVGLFPRRYESGTSVRRRPRLARGGGGRIRKGLFMSALCLCRRQGPIPDFGKRLVKKGKAKKSAVCAMMRKILVTARAVVISGKPYDPLFITQPLSS